MAAVRTGLADADSLALPVGFARPQSVKVDVGLAVERILGLRHDSESFEGELLLQTLFKGTVQHRIALRQR